MALALPALASLRPELALAHSSPALATTPSGAPLRMAFMSIPNGVQQDNWFPKGAGTEFEFNRTMEPLQSVKQHVQVLGGLDHENATAGNDGAGDHARSGATFLTGQRARKTAGKDIHVGVSVDQVAAQHYGHFDAFPFARTLLRCHSQFGQLRFGLCLCLSIQLVMEFSNHSGHT